MSHETFYALLGLAIPTLTGIVAMWRWQAQRIRRQDARIRVMLKSMRWLITKSGDKPDDSLIDELRDASREDL